MSASSQKVLSEPTWVHDPQILQKNLYQIFLRIFKEVEPSHLQHFFDGVALQNYWAKCFTHASVDSTNNYEKLEFYGDKVLNHAFAEYLRLRFKDELNQANGTLLLNQYMSKKFQAQLARELGLSELIRFDPEYPRVSVSVQEDIFEAFAGCIHNIAEDRIGRGLGQVYVFNMIAELFDPIPIVLAEVEKDKKTILKEIYEKMAWGEPNYVYKNTDNPSLGPFRVEVRSRTGDLLGFGYGSEGEAPFEAAANALKTLEAQNITWESADQARTERNRIRNPEFDRQYRRVQNAIERLNEQAKAQRTVPITDFKVAKVEERRTGGGFRYTFAIQIAYQTPTGLTWRAVQQLTGSDSDQTKIDLMRTFADKYGVPSNI